MRGMNINRRNSDRSIVATLARIDTQIDETGMLLLQSLTLVERERIKDELAYLQVERRNLTRKLKPK
jgi:hypothetical protein